MIIVTGSFSQLENENPFRKINDLDDNLILSILWMEAISNIFENILAKLNIIKFLQLGC